MIEKCNLLFRQRLYKKALSEYAQIALKSSVIDSCILQNINLIERRAKSGSVVLTAAETDLLHKIKTAITKKSDISISHVSIEKNLMLHNAADKIRHKKFSTLDDKRNFCVSDSHLKLTKNFLEEVEKDNLIKSEIIYSDIHKIGSPEQIVSHSRKVYELVFRKPSIPCWTWRTDESLAWFIPYIKAPIANNNNKKREWPLLNLKARIIIPVYKNYHLLKRLLDSLFKDESFIQSDCEVFLINDAPEDVCAPIHEIVKRFGERVHLSTNKENLGFGLSCNSAFKKKKGTDVTIIVNTDIELPNHWFVRVLLPFRDPTVALATPLSNDAENLTLDIPEGLNWTDVDQVLKTRDACYPDACTAIGFCIAIRDQSIKEDLFDQIYGKGYGEDSDLHYRLTSKGYRSVVIDNLYVYHEHGASFKIIGSRETLRTKNHKIFKDRWWALHSKQLEVFNRKLSAWFPDLKEISHSALGSSLDILFISPAMSHQSGGMMVIWQLAKRLNADGIKSSILLLGNGERHKGKPIVGLNPFGSTEKFCKQIASVKVVVSTCFDTIPLSESLADLYGAKHASLIQGPEGLFSGGRYYSLYEKLIRLPEHYFAVSPFLSALIENCYSIKPTCLYYGPDKFVFYNKKLPRRENTVVFQLSENLEKGLAFNLIGGRKFFDNGYNVIAFGTWNHECVPGWIDYRGWQSDFELANLFNEARFYLESSFYEGLGLLALEAASCGALPLIRKNGSSDTIFDCSVFSGCWSSLADLLRLIEKVVSLRADVVDAMASEANELSMSYQSDKGYSVFREKLGEIM